MRWFKQAKHSLLVTHNVLHIPGCRHWMLTLWCLDFFIKAKASCGLLWGLIAARISTLALESFELKVNLTVTNTGATCTVFMANWSPVFFQQITVLFKTFEIPNIFSHAKIHWSHNLAIVDHHSVTFMSHDANLLSVQLCGHLWK